LVIDELCRARGQTRCAFLHEEYAHEENEIVSTPLRVLLVEDEPNDAELVLRELQRGGFQPIHERVETRIALREALAWKSWDLVISDDSLPQYDGLSALRDARETGKDIPFILVSGTIGEVRAVAAMKAGANDYVLKDQLGRLPAAVEREVREARNRAEARKLREELTVCERMAATGMLAAGVAHEINNPLSALIANLEFISQGLSGQGLSGQGLRGGGNESIRDVVEEPLRDARDAAERIREIVRDVKLFSRPRDDAKGAVDIRRVLDSSIRMAWNEIKHRARLIQDYGAVPAAEGSEARLGQVFLNLLINAAHAMPEGKVSKNEIAVVARIDPAGRIMIEIRDSGSGIPSEIITRIFEPFFTTKPVGVGTGLGLSVCRRIVDDLGGEIRVESQVGKGSTFRVFLRPARGPSDPPAAMTISPASSARARILAIDDEEPICRAIKRSLSRFHDVLATTKPREAIARIREGERFDVILCDLMMPEMTGMELYAEVASEAPKQAARIVFLTGGAFTPRALEFLQSVPNARIEKPFQTQEILNVISSLTREPG
jgi:signal transduction histidine kinase